jgi:hypothetical protein
VPVAGGMMARTERESRRRAAGGPFVVDRPRALAIFMLLVALPVVVVAGVFGREPTAATARWGAAGQADPAIGVWQANPHFDDGAGTWTITLTRTDGALTGTVRQADMGPCEPEFWAIQSGTTDGRNLSFIIVGKQGRTVEFKGTVDAAGDAIDFVRLVPAPEATQGEPGILGAPDTKDFTARFTARRVVQTGGGIVSFGGHASSGGATCLVADLTAPSFAPNTQVRLVAEDVAFGPWTFDLTIGPDGAVIGSATQSQVDPKIKTSTQPGPFVLSKGAVWGGAIGFTLTYDNDQGRATFHGVRQGADDVDFSCFGVLKGLTAEPIAVQRVEAGRTVLVAAPHAARGLLTQASFRFTAKIVSSTALTPAPQDVVVAPPQQDETVAIMSVNDGLASVKGGPAAAEAGTGSPLAIVRYRVGAGFHGRLFALALKDNGDRLRQFEVIATPGDHAALWNLRVENAASAAATAAAQAAEPRTADLEVADERATLIANTLQQALAHPDEAPGPVSKIHAMLADVNPPGGAVVPPGLYSLARSPRRACLHHVDHSGAGCAGRPALNSH